ncbi:MAG TPA: carboxypeptidase regulatory-like domain-containing protein, partial [Candidatus Poseidoniales archaeon]|nr:carboxypeptidase regulatory-like domain-containing protein [Candidatus Poseidoniales archaeon]
MVSQQLECPVCFIRFDTERRAGQSVTCPSCDHTFNAPGEEEPATETAPAVQAEEAEEEAPDGGEEPAASEAAPEGDEAEEETPQGDELPDEEPGEAAADEGEEAGEAPETSEPEEDEPPASPEPTTPGALELLGELSTAYRTERLQSVIDGPRSRAQLAGLLLLAVAVLGLLAATATAVKWSSYDSPWDDEATASLHGSVIDVDGNPLEDVRVAASGQQTFTDGEGRYFLHNLTAGELKVTFF